MPRRVIALLAAITAIISGQAVAQPLGTFRWQLLPYCNVVTLSVTAQGSIFSLNGFDDQCGAGQRAGVTGTAFQNPDGTVGLGLNIVVAPGGSHVHVDARISLASLGGPWSDSAGNSGSFVPTASGNLGGPPRSALARPNARLFQPSELVWELATFAGLNVRQAVLSIPELTQAVIDRGQVQVLLTSPLLPEPPWIPLPYTELRVSPSYELFYAFGVGQVVLRLYASTGVDPVSTPLGFKVVITP